jgi:putative membrane protein
MADTAADRRLHPATLFIRFVRKVPEFVLGLPALVGFASNANMQRILLISLLGGTFALLGSLMTWLRFRYGVGERDIVIESGVLHRQRRVIPFDRVQDIDIEQRFLARLFGTAKVRIETGGGGKDEGDLDAVSLDEARRLRDVIRGAASHAAAVADAEEERLLFKMELPRLLLAGLFNFSLIYLAVVGGAFQYLQPLFERNIIDPDQLRVPTREQAAAAAAYVTLLLIALLLFLGVLTGVVRTVMRDYGFRLTRAPAGFRRRRGLLTLSEVIIPLRRVQLALIGSGWLRRRLGWFDLQFQTLSADAQQSGHQAATPFARIEEIVPILAEAGMEELPPLGAYFRVSRRAIWRRYLSDLIPLALAALIASLVWRPALLFLIPLGLAAIIVIFGWRRHRYALTAGALYMAEGVFRHRLWIMPFGSAQTISLRRSPLQRKFGLATLEVDTAGASLFRYPAIRDLEADAAEALAARLLQEYRAARRAPIL